MQCEGNHEWWQSFIRMLSKEIPARWMMENVDPRRIWCQMSAPSNLHIFSPLVNSFRKNLYCSLCTHPPPPPKCQGVDEKNIRRVQYGNIYLLGEETEPRIFFVCFCYFGLSWLSWGGRVCQGLGTVCCQYDNPHIREWERGHTLCFLYGFDYS